MPQCPGCDAAFGKVTDAERHRHPLNTTNVPLWRDLVFIPSIEPEEKGT
jgi:hypothetical protein